MIIRSFVISTLMILLSLPAVAREYASSSVLATGTWAKVSVETTGIHFISNSDLAAMGFSNPSAVAIYGNGGAQLPFSNAEERKDDLQQIPVYRRSDGILFYAQGPNKWDYSSSHKRFNCNVHNYDNLAYYFITDSKTASAEPATLTAQKEVLLTSTSNYQRAHFEEDNVNLLSSGRDWFGDEITNVDGGTTTISFDLEPRKSGGYLALTARIVGRSWLAALPFSIYFDDEEVDSGSFSQVTMGTTTSDYAIALTRNLSPSVDNTTDNKVKIVCTLSQSFSFWVDYVTITSETALDMQGADEYLFRDLSTYKASGATTYSLANPAANAVVWDVTDCTAPRTVPTTSSSASLSFSHDNKEGSEFVAFNPNGTFPSPTYVGAVENQNLHALEPVNYVIVAYSDFVEEAERLAQLHRENSGITVAVADVEQIYNEFSSGQRDVTAIRDFLKMMYDRDSNSETGLRNALLFGAAYYDSRTTTVHEKNLLPAYESANSVHMSQSYCTDDFFGFLGDSDGASDTGSRMRIGIGRFTARNAAEAKAFVDKSETYLTNLEPGSWKSKIAVVSDDGDSNEHVGYAELNAQAFENASSDFNIKRIFLEAYHSTTAATGIYYEQATKDFYDAVEDGSLIINYVGHGGYYSITDNGIFVVGDISNWSNKRRLPFFIAATCDFVPFDHPVYAAGENLVAYEDGGMIAVYSTTRVVFSSSNYSINSALNKVLITKNSSGRFNSLGEASRIAKNDAGGMINSLKYVLIGDPAIVLARNEKDVSTDVINGLDYDVCDEPMRALAESNIEGSVKLADGSVDESFNGEVQITLYDKKQTTKTTGVTSESVFEYEEYKSILYNGTADVVNGRFNASIFLSKDINFSLGYGRLSYYAISDDEEEEANGGDNQVLIGGISEEAVNDTTGPTITYWFDYEEFENGQTTGSTPILYAHIEDPSGINTSGSGIGHDITLYFNSDRNDYVNINEYFTYESGSYTAGTLRYQLDPLDDGLTEVAIKAWDNANNSTTVVARILVDANSAISFGKTNVYSTSADDLCFYFTHNAGGGFLDVELSVYALNGLRMAHGQTTLEASSLSTEQMIVLNDVMPEVACLPKGIYIIEAKINSTTGRSATVCKKFMVTSK